MKVEIEAGNVTRWDSDVVALLARAGSIEQDSRNARLEFLRTF
jgi:hypothetical protein